MYNKVHFTSSRFGEEAFTRKTNYEFMFMEASEAGNVHIYEITMNQVITNDKFLFGKSVNNTFASIAMFRSEKISTLPRFSNFMTFLVSHNLHATSRTVYSLTDWMNEVGGFHAWIHLFISYVLPLC